MDYKIFSKNEISKIHDYSVKILKNIGIRVPNKNILDLFNNNGAKVDYEKQIVKLSENLIISHLENIIKNQNEYYQSNSNKKKLKYIETSGLMIVNKASEVIETVNYNKRNSTIADMLKAIVIGNALKNINRVSYFVKPFNFNESYSNIIGYYILYLYSKKRNFLGKIDSVNTAKCVIEMAKEVADDEVELKNGRIIEYELNPCENLQYSDEKLSIALEFAKNNIRILAGHWCWMGYHTPMDYVSAITLSNANIIASMIIVNMINPKQLFLDYMVDIFTVNKNDPTIPLLGSPNQVIYSIAGKQLADFYGFKVCLANAGLTDSIEDNFQSGFERGVTAALAIAAGTKLIGVSGLLGSDQGVSLEELVIDNEMFDYLNFIFNRKLKVNDKTIDYNTLKEVGIGGNFIDLIAKNNKYKNFYWDSDIFVRKKYEAWQKNEFFENINNKIDNIIKNNYPPKVIISKQKVKKLEEILKFYIDKRIFDNFKKELDSVIKKK